MFHRSISIHRRAFQYCWTHVDTWWSTCSLPRRSKDRESSRLYCSPRRNKRSRWPRCTLLRRNWKSLIGKRTVSQLRHFVVETRVPWKSSWIQVSSPAAPSWCRLKLTGVGIRYACPSLPFPWAWGLPKVDTDDVPDSFSRCLSCFSRSSFFSARDEQRQLLRFISLDSPRRISPHVFNKWLRNSWASCCISLSKMPRRRQQEMNSFAVAQSGHSLFSLRNLLMNFFGCNAPVRLLPLMIVWKRSARHVRRFSFLFFWDERYIKTWSRKGLQKYRACSTELQ